MRDLSTFYEPILGDKDLREFVQLYERKITNKGDSPKPNRYPDADLVVYFDMTPQAIEVRLKEVNDGYDEVADVEIPLQRTTPSELRKAIIAAAEETTRQIMRNKYNQQLGSKFYLRVKVPAGSKLSFPGGAYKDGRWQLLYLSRDAVYSSFNAQVGSEQVLVTLQDVITRSTFPDWRTRRRSDAAGEIFYSMRPYLLSLALRGGLAMGSERNSPWGEVALQLALKSKIGIRGGLAYHELATTTQLSLAPGLQAMPRTTVLRPLIPFIGLGLHQRNLSLGIRYGVTIDAFIEPRYLNGAAWLSLERLPWLRLFGGYQTLRLPTETTFFSRFTPTASAQAGTTDFAFFTTGVGCYLPFK